MQPCNALVERSLLYPSDTTIAALKEYAPTVYRECKIYDMLHHTKLVVFGERIRAHTLISCEPSRLQKMERYYITRTRLLDDPATIDVREINPEGAQYADEISADGRFDGTTIFVLANCIEIQSGWWIRLVWNDEYEAIGVADVKRYAPRMTDAFARSISAAGGSIKTINKRRVIAPVMIPLGVFKTYGRSAQDNILQYIQWYIAAAEVINMCLPQPIAEAVVPEL